MAEVRGFRGVRYAREPGADLSSLVSPPYDVVSPDLQRALAARDPHNVILLELPLPDNDPYATAARTFAAWKQNGTLARDVAPTVYVYGQEFCDAAGRERRRLGVLVALRLTPYETGVVLPHEQTFPQHKEDRFRLISAAEAQFSPIFGIYDAHGAPRAWLKTFTSAAPAVQAAYEDVCHSLWAIPEAEAADWLTVTFADRQITIADGHHRYETALRYQQERRQHAPGAPPSWFDYVMIYLVEMGDPGLACEPTHRLVTAPPLPPLSEVERRLRDVFEVRPLPAPPATLSPGEIGLLMPEAAAVIRARQQLRRLPEGSLEVVTLHQDVFPRLYGPEAPLKLSYTHTLAEAQACMASGSCQAAYLLPPPRLEDLRAMARAGLKMPPKSTYFWPKAIAGLVIYDRDALP
ncbi:MAG: DUF1015 domain-containing protein [Armatimonadetes bacterium]|nr:DUF1015 domain-containing protein [Armatimonadota bacterium]